MNRIDYFSIIVALIACGYGAFAITRGIYTGNPVLWFSGVLDLVVGVGLARWVLKGK